jgi:hypothetical protein
MPSEWRTGMDWELPGYYCLVCGNLLILHWRGRECLTPDGSESEKQWPAWN